MAINNTVPASQNALNNKLYPPLSSFLPSSGSTTLSAIGKTQTSTPAGAVLKPNTQSNIAYGAPAAVSSGSYTSNPASNLSLNNPNASLISAGFNSPQPQSTPSPTSNTSSYSAPAPVSNPNAGLISNMFGSSQGVPVTPTPTTQTTPPAQTTPTPTYTGLVGQLAQTATTPNPQYLESYQKAQEYQKQLQESQMNQAGALAANAGNPIPLEFQQGRAQILNTQYGQQQAALGSALQGESALAGLGNAQQGLQQSGLNQAAGYAAPQLAGYNQQGFNPLTGQFSGGGSLNDAVSRVVQKLQSGQMTYNDALGALSGYGQGGINALQQALPQGFNIAQSNTLGAQQGSIGPALDYARQAMSNLKSAFSGLSVPGQNSNVQPIADVSNWFSNLSGLGKEAVRTKEGALAEARSAIQKVLASVQGGTPTDYTGQSHALLPDNATPADVDAALKNLEALGTAKQNIYGNPGQSGSGTSGGSLFGW